MTFSARTAIGSNRGTILMSWLMVFSLLDICTTTFGLSKGFSELNPFVASMMHLSGLEGLVLTKVAAILLASYFLYSGRLRLLRQATVFMGAVVCWNVFWLVAR